MKYLAAYLLLVQGGNASPSSQDISSLLESVGVEVESDRLSLLLRDLEGKDIGQLIAEGNTKLASVPSGGAAVSSSAGAGAAAGGAAAEEAAEEAKEEEKEESDDDMGFGLFD
ncbi:ribosomal protein P2 [Lodderomyces beijingensis]|uniref:60S acidic ribosomal protein P2 n=1 Tax=Lodderomyces beijingensis TaxID=1775926 RepID=A0ABP0ZLN0_9ASCO